MATLTTMRTQVTSILGLDNTAGGDQPLVDEWLNRGVRDILVRTHCTVVPATMNLTADTFTYTLDATILAIESMFNTFDGTDRLMERVSIDELRDMRRLTSTSIPPAQFYSVRGQTLYLYPTPGSGEVLTIDAVVQPTEMSAGGNDPASSTYGSIPLTFHDAIEFYALARGGEYLNHAPSQYGQYYRVLYEKRLVEIRSFERQIGGNRLPRAKLNRSGRRTIRVPSDPSVPWNG